MVNPPKFCQTAESRFQTRSTSHHLATRGSKSDLLGFGFAWYFSRGSFAVPHCTNCFSRWHLPLPPVGDCFWHPSSADLACFSLAGGSLSSFPHQCPAFTCVAGGIWGGSVQLCLFANRLLYPTRKAIWIRTVCLAAAQRFSLKPAGSRWINRTQRYRLNPCQSLILLLGWDVHDWSSPAASAHVPLLVTYLPCTLLVSHTLNISTCASEPLCLSV